MSRYYLLVPLFLLRGQVVFLFLSFSFSPRNNSFTSVEMLIASIRESCGFLIQTVLSVLNIWGLVNNQGLVWALCLAQNQILLRKWHWLL